MKTTMSPNPIGAAEVTRRSRESIHAPPPIWFPAVGLSVAAEHAKACTPNTLRRSTLRAFTLLCAVALFTHATFAAKPVPNPPPPPPPSSGTLVMDYLYPGGTYAENFGLTVAPSGTIFASGIAADEGSTNHAVVVSSGDGGGTWIGPLDDFAPPGHHIYSWGLAAGIASDAAGNLFAAGYSYNNDGGPDQWYVRRSTDGGATWITVDQFLSGFSNAGDVVTDIAAAAGGDIYVSGIADDGPGHQSWTIRKGVGGTSFSTVDVLPNSYPKAVFAHPSAGVFAVGYRNIVIKNNTNSAWMVRRSTDGGATWSNVDTFQLSSGLYASAWGIGTDTHGLYVVGKATTTSRGSNVYHWLVRKSTDGGNSWTTVDDFVPGGNVQARCFAQTSNGDLFVAGVIGSYGAYHWIVRKNPGGTGGWTTIDDYQYAPGVSTEPHAIAADGLGKLFIGGTGDWHWLIKKY